MADDLLIPKKWMHYFGMSQRDYVNHDLSARYCARCSRLAGREILPNHPESTRNVVREIRRLIVVRQAGVPSRQGFDRQVLATRAKRDRATSATAGWPITRELSRARAREGR